MLQPYNHTLNILQRPFLVTGLHTGYNAMQQTRPTERSKEGRVGEFRGGVDAIRMYRKADGRFMQMRTQSRWYSGVGERQRWKERLRNEARETENE